MYLRMSAYAYTLTERSILINENNFGILILEKYENSVKTVMVMFSVIKSECYNVL